MLEEDDDPEDMVAMMDHSQWTGPGTAEPNMPPSLQQMFTLARLVVQGPPVRRQAPQG